MTEGRQLEENFIESHDLFYEHYFLTLYEEEEMSENREAHHLSKRRFSRREMLKGIGVGTVGLVLASCAPPSEPAAQPSAADTPQAAAPPAEPTSIIWHARTDTEKYYTSEIERFHAAQDKVRIKHEVIPNNEYDQKLATLAAAGDLGDAYWGNVFGQLYPFAAAGIPLDVAPLIEASDISTDDFFEVAIEQVTWDNKLIGLPMNGHPGWTTLYTNITAFDEVGVPLPEWEWTYQNEFLDAVKAVHKGDENGDGNPDRFGYEFHYSAQQAYTFIRCWGGNWTTDDGKTATLLSEETLDAMAFMRALVEDYQVSPRPDQVVDQMFANGFSATWSHGIWQYGAVKPVIGDKFEWRGFPMPAGPAGRGSFIGCDTFCINSKSKNVEAAFEWAKWLVSVDAQIAAFEAARPPALLKKAWEDPVLKDDPTLQAMLRWMEVSQPWTVPANARALEFRNTFNQQITGVMDPQNDFMKEMETLNAAIQGVLDKPTV